MTLKKNKFLEDTTDIKNQEKYANKVREYVKNKEAELGRKLYAYINTFGCQQNEADGERLMGTALSLGYEKCYEIEKADLVIYNTCAVREHAELKALSKTGQLKHLKQNNPEVLTGIWGCMVSQEHRVDDIKNKYPYVDFVAGTNMLHRLPEILCDVIENNRRRYYVDNDDYSIVEGVPVERESDIKAWVSIMYGCNNFCTYCVVPYVRGRERSRTFECIINEVKGLVEDGYKEITLLGQNVNSYGSDTDGKYSFAKLLSEVAELPGEFIVRFMTSHPKDVSDELINVIKTHEKVSRHFHLPVQSGSGRILDAMNRKYTVEKYLQVVEKLKSQVPDIVLTTDIIVGFPGETDKDFEDTLNLIEKVGYDSIYSFIYSPRKGTLAEKMDDPTEYSEKSDRMARLMELHREKVTAQNKKYIGKTVKVLCEVCTEALGKYNCLGRTSGNKSVKFVSENNGELYGKFVDVNISDAGDVYLFGEYKEK